LASFFFDNDAPNEKGSEKESAGACPLFVDSKVFSKDKLAEMSWS
jgi:hypothetical protein